MSFQAKLRLDDDHANEMVVLAADYEFSQSMDSQNLPNGRPNAGIVNVTLASGRDNKIVEWMVSPKMTKYVMILFKGKDGSTIKLLELTNTYCVGYRETFNANDTNPMKMVLRLSAWDIRVNIIYGKTNDWAEFQSSRSGANIADSSTNPPGAGGPAAEQPGVTYQPDAPAAPETPTVPEAPAMPEAPAVPDVPAIPEAPPIPAVPLPDMPAVPDVPSVPDIPTLPEAPPIPGVPLPDMPAIPDVPSVPDIPALPEAPPIPGVPLPDMPAIPGVPSVPNIPSVPAYEMPDLPSAPPVPNMPDLPSPPKIPTPYSEPPDLPSVPSFIP